MKILYILLCLFVARMISNFLWNQITRMRAHITAQKAVKKFISDNNLDPKDVSYEIRID